MAQKTTFAAEVCRFLYTGFYSGYAPKAPGTAGSVVAWVLLTLLHFLVKDHGAIIHSCVTILMLYPAVLLGNVAEKDIGEKDPQIVVLDEMMGYWIALLFIPYSFTASLLGLVLFRFFDILKPWPIYGLQKYKGGFGIMIDDYVAGIFANIIIWGVILVQNLTGLTILL